MNVVLDTNVLISALINPEGVPAQVLNLVVNGKLVLLYDNRIIKEYTDVLSRKKFGFSLELILPLIDFIQNDGIFITAEPQKKQFIYKDDKKFYELALTGNASYLITGNKKHFPKDSIIVSPADFVSKL